MPSLIMYRLDSPILFYFHLLDRSECLHTQTTLATAYKCTYYFTSHVMNEIYNYGLLNHMQWFSGWFNWWFHLNITKLKIPSINFWFAKDFSCHCFALYGTVINLLPIHQTKFSPNIISILYIYIVIYTMSYGITHPTYKTY